MIFSAKAIRDAINSGDLKVDPLKTSSIKPAHVDLHLQATGGEALAIPAGGFVLAKTSERITLSLRLCAFMEGKASLAKRGISIEQSSTFIEPGSDSQMTLEIFNASDQQVILENGQAIAKMFVTRVVDSFS